MKLFLRKQPRVFNIPRTNISISDYGSVELGCNEMLSFKTASGRHCDFTAKEWGFYPMSSLNHRMKEEGFKVALVTGADKKLQVNVVEESYINKFKEYLRSQIVPRHIVCWLDELTPDLIQAIQDLIRKRL